MSKSWHYWKHLCQYLDLIKLQLWKSNYITMIWRNKRKVVNFTCYVSKEIKTATRNQCRRFSEWVVVSLRNYRFTFLFQSSQTIILLFLAVTEFSIHLLCSVPHLAFLNVGGETFVIVRMRDVVFRYRYMPETVIHRVLLRSRSSGPRLNIKTVLSTYGDFHVKDKTAVRTSYL